MLVSGKIASKYIECIILRTASEESQGSTVGKVLDRGSGVGSLRRGTCLKEKGNVEEGADKGGEGQIPLT